MGFISITPTVTTAFVTRSITTTTTTAVFSMQMMNNMPSSSVDHLFKTLASTTMTLADGSGSDIMDMAEDAASVLTPAAASTVDGSSAVTVEATSTGGKLLESASTIFQTAAKSGSAVLESTTGADTGDVSGSVLESAGNMFQTVGVVITAVIGIFIALTFLYASFIIPAAAKQLEQEAKELAPDLLNEYLAKLEDGQKLSQRPDLMQELGTKLTPLIEQKAMRMNMQQQQQGGGGGTPASVVSTDIDSTTADSSSFKNSGVTGVVDVEVIENDDDPTTSTTTTTTNNNTQN